MSRFLSVLAATSALAMLSACADSPTHQAPTAAYRCDDGSRFTTRFDPDSVSVFLANGRTVELPQQRAGSGMWYAGNGYELRGKGDDATWTAPGAAPLQCRSV